MQTIVEQIPIFLFNTSRNSDIISEKLQPGLPQELFIHTMRLSVAQQRLIKATNDEFVTVLLRQTLKELKSNENPPDEDVISAFEKLADEISGPGVHQTKTEGKYDDPAIAIEIYEALLENAIFHNNIEKIIFLYKASATPLH